MNSATRARAAAVLLTVGGLVACGGAESGGTPGGQEGGSGTAGAAVAVSPDARQQAQEIFATRCAVCHGAEGRGDGPGGAGLTPKPRDYHDTAWQDSVSDEEIERAIVYGGAAVGRSPAMVGNPDLAAKPDVVAALREIIRNFGKQR